MPADLSPRTCASTPASTSKRKARGDAVADRSLKFPKPSLTIDWQPRGGWHTQFILRRVVNQLDFYDFVSSAEISVGRVNGGNQPSAAAQLGRTPPVRTPCLARRQGQAGAWL